MSHTSLRGIAAFLVVMCHYRTFLPEEMHGGFVFRLFQNAYSFVDMFFILSGFILTYVYRKTLLRGLTGVSVSRFYVARLARVYPLHIATLAPFVLLGLASGKPFDTEHFAYNILLIHAWGPSEYYSYNFPSWSISAEAAAYLLFPLLFLLNEQKVGRIAMAVAILASYSFLFVTHGGLGQSIDDALFRALPGFMVGMLLYDVSDRVSQHTSTALSIAQVGSVCLIVAVLGFGFSDFVAIPAFAILIGATAADRGIAARFLRARPLWLLGLWSYAIYMLHIPVRKLAEVLTDDFRAEWVADQDWTILLTLTVATLVLGALACRFYEMPAKRWLNGLVRGRSRREPPAAMAA